MNDIPTRQPSPWPRRVVIGGLIWAALTLTASTLSEPTPENQTLFFSIIGSGLYTLALYATRQAWLPLLSRRPLRNAALLGIVNAALIEALFWAVEKLTGATGVAASPNLLLDWIITMPWYIGMMILFARAQNRRRFPAALVLLLGAVYEAGADGLVGGQVIPLLFGQAVNILEFWIFLPLLAFWQFIPVYSSMVLPPAWVVETGPPAPPPDSPAWHDALRPLLWLIPFLVYALGLMVVIALVSGGS